MDIRELKSALKNKLGNCVNFMGIYASDKLPNITHNTKPIVFIANILKSTVNINIVGHWVAFYFEFSPKKRIVFFDSYGLSPNIYINSGFSKFLNKYKNISLYHFGNQFQPDNSMKCGLYVCMFVHYVSLYGIENFSSFLFNKFHYNKKHKKTLALNDVYVTRYFFKYLSKIPCSHWKYGNKRAIKYKECLHIQVSF